MRGTALFHVSPNTDAFYAALAAMPLIAILRGLRPDEAEAVGDALAGAGVRIIEVPLNSPEPFRSIRSLRDRLPDAVIGAGTVLDPADVARVADAGGTLVIAPNYEPAVVRKAVEGGLVALPGVATPSEAFAALAMGAAALKLFPCEMIPPAAVKAMLAVLPKGVRLIPVGGIDAQTIPAYRAQGAVGFGVGSAIFKPGDDPAAVRAKAEALVQAARA